MPLIYSLVFLGFFAGALVSPVMSPMFLHPQEHGVLSHATSGATRAFLLGLAMAMIKLGEFFGSPILGQLSDHLGRKIVLAAAMAITAIGNLAIGLAIAADQVWVIIAGQFFIGFAGVLLVLAQSEVASLSTGKEKPQRFGYIYLASSLAYVFAPVLGGHLADKSYLPWASYSLPFYVSTAISLLCTLLILWRFPKSVPKNNSKASLKLTRGLSEIGEAFRLAPFRSLLIVNFFIYLGIDFVFQFNPVYFVQKWKFSSAEVGWLMSYTSASMVLTQWLLITPAGKRWTPRIVTTGSAIALGILLTLQIAPKNWQWLCLILPLVGVTMALATTNMSALLSNNAPTDAQGRMLGVSHSVRVMGSALLCFTGGILAGLSPQYPILIGAIASIFSAGLLIYGGRK
ncbi:MAG: MFS transporter [Planctomycetaceae bacterium]|nr:MFS transporter [Planctomycetaceae bacterium]